MLKTFRHCCGYLNLSTDYYKNTLFTISLSTQNKQKSSQLHQKRDNHTNNGPQHLICYKNWQKELIKKIISSAINLKCACNNTHGKQMNVLPNTKVIIFEDHNEPILRMAVSKAASFLSATDVYITGEMLWNNDYNGRIFSDLADVIFVSTQVFECVRRFARCSTVPVISMRCRRHATLQGLATLMSIMEDYGSLDSFNLAYIGAPHPIVNDYLMFSTMFNINFNFKCCCKKVGVSPLLLEVCKEKCKKTPITINQTCNTDEALKNSNVIIAGPTTVKEKIPEFQLSADLINKYAKPDWTFYHTFPRGAEVDDDLFWHCKTRTFNAFKNTQYIAAAIMAYVVRGFTF